jgi:hypothetical protein
MPGTYLDEELDTGVLRGHNLENSVDVMLLQPVDHEAIGGKQTQDSTVFDGLQRPDPGIKVLLGQLRLKITDATIPERHLGCQLSPQKLVSSLLE